VLEILCEKNGGHPAGSQLALDAVAVGEGGLQGVELTGLVGHGTALLQAASLRCGLAGK
jgi:hypothetical protein